MKRIILAAGIIFTAAVAVTAWQGASGKLAQRAHDERVARGNYLVSSIGCSDCHTPKTLGPDGPEPDMARLLAGHPEGTELPVPPAAVGPWIASATWDMTAWSGPWGISFAPNLTPDQNTGLGIWTEDMFLNAIRKGRHMGVSRPILPPMPWQVFRNLTDEDLKAIFAYLRSVPPIHNRVPEPVEPQGAAAN